MKIKKSKNRMVVEAGAFRNSLKSSKMNKCLKKAFTLAEVLITLSVIGLIAMLVLPRAIENYQKHITANQVKIFYSIVKHAFDGAIGKYGPVKYWVYDSAIMNFEKSYSTYEQNKAYVEKYLAPYLKIDEIKKTEDVQNFVLVKLKNGMSFTLNFQNVRPDTPDGLLLIDYYVDGDTNNRTSRNMFCFMAEVGARAIKPFELSWEENREKLINDATWGCALGKWANRQNPRYCTKLLELNNWTFPDDYPW